MICLKLRFELEPYKLVLCCSRLEECNIGHNRNKDIAMVDELRKDLSKIANLDIGNLVDSNMAVDNMAVDRFADDKFALDY
jgi:hypothetical protein